MTAPPSRAADNDTGAARDRRRPAPKPGPALFAFDRDRCPEGTVAGADEAGRGCLAGPLVAAAVCFDYRRLSRADVRALGALDDSKRLTRPVREQLLDEILRRARQVTIVCSSPHTIDREGLHRCNLAALTAALAGLSPQPDLAFVDGFALPRTRLPHEAVIGGDGRSASIAAASIVAKVTRDRLMLQLHERYPDYGFDHHVGYATPEHRAAIARHGICALHRLSFASVAYTQLKIALDFEVPADVPPQ